MSNGTIKGTSNGETPAVLTLVYLLQAMKLAVSRGTRYWVHDQVRVERIDRFHQNMRAKRGVNAARMDRHVLRPETEAHAGHSTTSQAERAGVEGSSNGGGSLCAICCRVFVNQVRQIMNEWLLLIPIRVLVIAI